MRKKLLKFVAVILTFITCFTFSNLESKAEEDIFIGTVFALDSDGNVITYSGASVVMLTNGEEVCITTYDVYYEGAFYVFAYGDYMEEIYLKETCSTYGVILLSVPSFCTSLKQAPANSISSNTPIKEVCVTGEGTIGWADTYCTANSGAFWSLDMSGLPGTPMAGSPVVDGNTYEALGILVDEEYNTFVDLKSIVELMGGSAAPATSEENDSTAATTEESNPSGNTTETSTGQETTEETYDGSGSSGGSRLSYGFVILAIVIALGILIFSISKGSKRTGDMEKEYVGIIDEDDSPLTLQCTDGVHKGLVIPLEEVITLGRDGTKCNLVFPNDAQGVSSVHCQVSRWNDKVELIDLGSSYGTFLADGTKLAPNVPYTLERRDSFYIGDKRYFYCIK